MAFRGNLSVAAIIATIAGLAAAIEVRAGADKVVFRRIMRAVSST